MILSILSVHRKKEISIMSVARTTEISASSKKGFEAAIEKGIKRCTETIQNVEGAWIKEQKVVVKDGSVSEYRVTMKVSFVLKD
jgi:flavin-binding protein dodecin